MTLYAAVWLYAAVFLYAKSLPHLLGDQSPSKRGQELLKIFTTQQF